VSHSVDYKTKMGNFDYLTSFTAMQALKNWLGSKDYMDDNIDYTPCIVDYLKKT
jgi:hypothetical protein